MEDVRSDEEAKAQQIADTMNKMQKHNFDKASLPSPATAPYTGIDSQ